MHAVTTDTSLCSLQHQPCPSSQSCRPVGADRVTSLFVAPDAPTTSLSLRSHTRQPLLLTHRRPGRGRLRPARQLKLDMDTDSRSSDETAPTTRTRSSHKRPLDATLRTPKLHRDTRRSTRRSTRRGARRGVGSFTVSPCAKRRRKAHTHTAADQTQSVAATTSSANAVVSHKIHSVAPGSLTELWLTSTQHNAAYQSTRAVGALYTHDGASVSTLQGLKHLPQLAEHYELVRHIGQGTYGQVWEARAVSDRAPRARVAVKWLCQDSALADVTRTQQQVCTPDYTQVRSSDSSESQTAEERQTVMFEAALREVRISLAMNHTHISRVLSVYQHKGCLAMSMPLYHSDLTTLMSQTWPDRPPNPDTDQQLWSDHWQNISSLAFQLLSALACIHEQGIVHRDVKPSNVFVSGVLSDTHERAAATKRVWGTYRYVLGDFSLARHRLSTSPQVMTQEVAPIPYRDPRLLLGECAYDESVDLWSLGCTLLSAALCTQCVFLHQFRHNRKRRRATPAVKTENKGAVEHTTDEEDEEAEHVLSLVGAFLGYPPAHMKPVSGNDKQGLQRRQRRWSRLCYAAQTVAQAYPEGMLAGKMAECHVPVAVARLITQLLSYEPEQRGTARSLLTTHPAFTAFASPDALRDSPSPIRA